MSTKESIKKKTDNQSKQNEAAIKQPDWDSLYKKQSQTSKKT